MISHKDSISICPVCLHLAWLLIYVHQHAYRDCKVISGTDQSTGWRFPCMTHWQDPTRDSNAPLPPTPYSPPHPHPPTKKHNKNPTTETTTTNHSKENNRDKKDKIRKTPTPDPHNQGKRRVTNVPRQEIKRQHWPVALPDVWSLAGPVPLVVVLPLPDNQSKSSALLLIHEHVSTSKLQSPDGTEDIHSLWSSFGF